MRQGKGFDKSAVLLNLKFLKVNKSLFIGGFKEDGISYKVKSSNEKKDRVTV